jgi:hypothetical protein
VKSFIGASTISEFHVAVGQFVTKLFFKKEKSPLIKGGRGVVSKEIRGKK